MFSDIFVQILLDTLDDFGLQTERPCSHKLSTRGGRYETVTSKDSPL